MTKSVKIDMKLDGPLEFIRDPLGKSYKTYHDLYKEYIESGKYKRIIFSEVRGELTKLINYAKDNGYNVYITDIDQQNFRMLIFYKDNINPKDYNIDFTDIYNKLLNQQKNQKENDYSIIDIGYQKYKLNLHNFDFSKVPPTRIGLDLGNIKISQYIPPGPPNPYIKGTILSKLIYLCNEVYTGCSHIGDFNIPFDIEIFDIDGNNIVPKVFKSISNNELILNNGSTIRMTMFDIIGRRKLGLPGFSLQYNDENEYIKSMLDHRSLFDRVYNLKNITECYFGPQINLSEFDKIKNIMWDDGFINKLNNEKNKDKNGTYIHTNKFWETLVVELEQRGIFQENIIKFLFEEDHVRIEWEE
jgi:hypothetical protein